jgi:hypothetical protein
MSSSTQDDLYFLLYTIFYLHLCVYLEAYLHYEIIKKT